MTIEKELNKSEITSDLEYTTRNTKRIKLIPDNQNEIHDLESHKDSGNFIATCVMQASPETMSELVTKIKNIVQQAHKDPSFLNPDSDGVHRAQTFEEGTVFMVEKPFQGYAADRYLMNFFDVKQKGICSRMHGHTGMRFVRIMTGPDTTIRIASLSPIEINGTLGFKLLQEIDEMPDMAGKKRYSVIAPPNSIVDGQIPAGVSHQFNADGPNAVIDSVHPEESIEVFREKMKGFNMLAQTYFLSENHPNYEKCTSNNIEQYSSELQKLYSVLTNQEKLDSIDNIISPAPHFNIDGTHDKKSDNILQLQLNNLPGQDLKKLAGELFLKQDGVKGVEVCKTNKIVKLTTTPNEAGEKLQQEARGWREKIREKSAAGKIR